MDLDWWDKSLCFTLNLDPKIFDIERDSDKTYLKALSYCERCPAQEECLEYAMEEEKHATVPQSMMYGGLLPSERRRLKGARIRRARLAKQNSSQEINQQTRNSIN